ncbi:Uncharacterised protein [Vibrio cholerae]|uniref:Uncharacterized protein n=1 Tax=Vibrio cholerae TaxID=666 RepID=A0A655ZFQ9_VIBCL|nr:Uncharacterised protein [Vibrio cholerae]
MPRALRSLVGKRRCGLEGPAKLRSTLERSNSSTRSYSACSKLSAHKPAALA